MGVMWVVCYVGVSMLCVVVGFVVGVGFVFVVGGVMGLSCWIDVLFELMF